MKYKVTNRKINFILDELAEEYKDLLIETALMKHNEFDIEKINISEITKIDIETKERLKNSVRNRRVEKISRLIYFIGMIYSLFGLMLIMLTENRDAITTNPLSVIAIICFYLGFIIVFLGFILKISLKGKRNKNTMSAYIDYEIQLINAWRTIESLIYQASPQNDSLSLRSMINNLEQAKILSKEDLRTINVLMHYRNKIIHDTLGERVQYNDVKKLLIDAKGLIKKLSNI